MSILKAVIFEYDNYRKFLKDTYDLNKISNRKFSFRFFARSAGYKSPSILQEIIAGKKNLSLEGVERFAKALKLNPQETNFFKNLVFFNQAIGTEDKLKYAQDLARSRIYKMTYPLAESQFRYFKFWFLTAIREMVALPGFKEDPQWIAKHLVPSISVQEATRAIEDLLKLGLLKRDERNNLIQSENIVSTPDEVSSAYITNWHKEYLKKAAESIDSVSRDLRDITAVYFTFSEENLKSLKEMIQKFRKDVLDMAGGQQNKNSVFQINIQLFPVARSNKVG